jgi:predicted RNase H-like HicB family nuclease
MSIPTIEFRLAIVIRPEADGFRATCPELPGVDVVAASEEEAVASARAAAAGELNSMLQNGGDAVPFGALYRTGPSSTLANEVRELFEALHPGTECKVRIEGVEVGSASAPAT